LDFDSFLLMRLILRSRGRRVRLLADHLWFKLPGIRCLWTAAGAVDGTRRNAIELLARGEVVLTYPGGVREIMGSRFRREHVDWEGRTGFAAVAMAAGVAVIPVAGLGVNSGHIFLTSGRRLGRLLFGTILRRLLDLGPCYEDYRDPLTIGLLPVPLPFGVAVHLPLPCRVRYVMGEPLRPVKDETEGEFANRVAEALRRLLFGQGGTWIDQGISGR
jgi:1-acyl-sn-glycerol-3-phosphate acyltransferase